MADSPRPDPPDDRTAAPTRTAGALAVARGVVERGRSAGVGFLAAAVAYYALVSLVPLVALAALALATVAGEAVADRVVLALGESLSVSGRETVRRVLTSAAGRARATVVGVAVLLWGAVRLFRGLDRSVARVYGVDDGGTARRARDAVAALAAVVTAAVALVGVALLAPAWAPAGPVAAAAGWVLRVAVLVVLLVPAFRVLPDARVTVREVLPGCVVTAVGWTALFVGFERLVGLAGGSPLSGALGGAVLAVTWLYAAAYVFLVGVVVDAELAAR
ncbi:YhjD/YihY/BrkB family envelope integrity protein [Halobaculum litoreum]|uniref:YhjD/YihY/BrkB family envelope integrity protein n=1 Tax=Halobaculum litoreum TaxID=3031998 RepID=A0ABD5XPU5_9EURY|nr:YhjD/YihY/BrkB family envelope integrity protein [Halobaculum sp. DT92]